MGCMLIVLRRNIRLLVGYSCVLHAIINEYDTYVSFINNSNLYLRILYATSLLKVSMH